MSAHLPPMRPTFDPRTKIENTSFYISVELPDDKPIPELIGMKTPFGVVKMDEIKDDTTGTITSYKCPLFYLTREQNVERSNFLYNVFDIGEEFEKGKGALLRDLIFVICKKLLDVIGDPEFDYFRITIFAPRLRGGRLPDYGPPQVFNFYLRDMERMMKDIPEEFLNYVEI